MPKGAVLINTARKEVINEADLLKIMQERPDFRYLSDVQPGNHAELTAACAGRYFCTPNKMGAQTAEANNNAGIAAARQIIGFLKDGDRTYQVNK
jgi:D-3-phosphoglycerate dehydrogenase